MINLINFRKQLHKNPELSNQEVATAKIIHNYIKQYLPDKTFIFNTGSAFVFKGQKKGKNLMFRADMDALPIKETSNIDYASVNPGVSHSCGHDGHMAILTGLAKKISVNRPKKGNVILLFQPAEETGEGAKMIVNHSKFKEIEPHYIFGLHNSPGFKKHQIIIKRNSFTSASRGMIIKLYGKTSHAAEPENGVSPVFAIEKIINRFSNVVDENKLFKSFVLLTITHIKLGEVAFGTSPGYAEIMLTLRSYTNDDMNVLVKTVEELTQQISLEENLKHEISYTEIFPAINNNDYCIDAIIASAKENKYEILEMNKAFKWSEDFSYFTEKYKGAFFGLGAGVNHPQLHSSEYDFPDEIIETGINMFYEIYRKILM